MAKNGLYLRVLRASPRSPGDSRRSRPLYSFTGRLARCGREDIMFFQSGSLLLVIIGTYTLKHLHIFARPRLPRGAGTRVQSDASVRNHPLVRHQQARHAYAVDRAVRVLRVHDSAVHRVFRRPARRAQLPRVPDAQHLRPEPRRVLPACRADVHGAVGRPGDHHVRYRQRDRRCRSARAPRQHTVLSPSRARPRCGGNRCRLRGRWARRRDRGDRRRSGCRS